MEKTTYCSLFCKRTLNLRFIYETTSRSGKKNKLSPESLDPEQTSASSVELPLAVHHPLWTSFPGEESLRTPSPALFWELKWSRPKDNRALHQINFFHVKKWSFNSPCLTNQKDFKNAIHQLLYISSPYLLSAAATGKMPWPQILLASWCPLQCPRLLGIAPDFKPNPSIDIFLEFQIGSNFVWLRFRHASRPQNLQAKMTSGLTSVFRFPAWKPFSNMVVTFKPSKLVVQTREKWVEIIMPQKLDGT